MLKVSTQQQGKGSTRKPVDYLIGFFLLLCLNFFLVRMLPGDPIAAIYGEEALLIMDSTTKGYLIKELGLNNPLGIQLWHYTTGLLRLDLGWSYHFQQPVSEILARFAPWTFLLVGTSMVISVFAGFLLGVEAGWNHGRGVDLVLSALMMVLNCLPSFVFAMFLLMTFGFTLGWFPLSGAVEPFSMNSDSERLVEILHHMILPVLSLVAHEIASIFFLARGSSLLIMNRPFIQVGRAKGLKGRLFKRRYIGRNALMPTITRLGVMIPHALTGVLFVEVIFGYPGLGQLAYDAILSHDYPVVQGVFLLIGTVVFAVNFIIDTVVGKLAVRG